VPFDGLADLPLLTIAWRALRGEYQRHAEERTREQVERRHMRETLASIADQVYCLRRAMSAPTPEAFQVQHLSPIAERLEQLLAQLEVAIVAPEGNIFSDELMELFENIAQQPDAAIDAPRIVQVVTPAILYRGALAQMGKVVIAVPNK
jgi:molecular chaperone GrpE (heat shock protein)